MPRRFPADCYRSREETLPAFSRESIPGTQTIQPIGFPRVHTALSARVFSSSST